MDFKYGASEVKESQVLLDIISRIAEKSRGTFKYKKMTGDLGKKFTYRITATSDHHAISAQQSEESSMVTNANLNKSFD